MERLQRLPPRTKGVLLLLLLILTVLYITPGGLFSGGGGGGLYRSGGSGSCVTHFGLQELESFSMDVRMSKTYPPFLVTMPVEGAACSNLPGHFVRHLGYFAPIETMIFHEILIDGCRKRGPDGLPPLVVDVGGNIGYFALYAARMGCRVKVFEPIPHIIRYLNASVALNGFDVDVFNYAASASRGSSKITLNCDDSGLSFINPGDPNAITIETIPLDDVVHEDVLLVKIDTEGHEDYVLRGMKNLLANYNVQNIVCETKQGGNAQFKREFINKAMKDGYKVQSYMEEYGGQDRWIDLSAGLGPKAHYFHDVSPLGPTDWIQYEDLWYRKQ